MSIGWSGKIGRAAVAALALVAVSCATRTSPAVTPDVVVRTQPAVPRELASHTADVAAYEQAWTRIRSGDVRAGERALSDLLKKSASFAPAAASLGVLRLEKQQYREAGVFFSQALGASPKYLPALEGLVDARLGERDDPGALEALQALLTVDPARADARSRLEVVGLRVSQADLAAADKLQAAGQLDAAEARLLHALQATPQNGAVLRALASVELARNAPEAAEARAREAIALDPQDAGAMATLGDALEAQGRFREAAASYARALAISPNSSWSQRREALQARSASAALPAGYQAIAGATAVTRAQVAAMLGVRLASALDRAPARSSEIVTDVRGHWASAWILPVVRAGWMEALPNHTFQPAGVVRRADLARIVMAVSDSMAGARRGQGRDVPANVTLADVPRDHAAYRAAAFAVSAGIMTVDAGKRFLPAGVVSGAELIAVMTRLESRVQ